MFCKSSDIMYNNHGDKLSHVFYIAVIWANTTKPYLAIHDQHNISNPMIIGTNIHEHE